MRQADRQTRILQKLRHVRFLSVGDLALEFQVSEETVRRDLRQLEDLGEVEKVHGGAMLRDRGNDAPFLSRLHAQTREKERIARRAMEDIPRGSTLFIDAGSTCCAVAQLLNSRGYATVVTYSTEVARVLAGGTCTVFLAPGELDPEDLSVYGPATAAFLDTFKCDIALLSAAAIDAEVGFLDFKPKETWMKTRMIAAARETMVVADATKFGRAGFSRFARLDEVAYLVTDGAPPEKIANALRPGALRLAQEFAVG